MTERPTKVLSVLRLCRIGTWFSPAADVLASSAIAQVALGVDVVRAMLASVLIYGAGMVWNDVADRKLDRRQRPERPLPSGDLSMAFAVTLGLLLLGGGIGLSPCRAHHGLIAALVLVYDFLGKRLEWLGALNMGVLRALNLSTGLFLASDAIPDEARRALLIAALCYGIYIVAVTFVGIFEDTPSVRGRTVATVQAAPPLVAFAGIAVVQGAFWPAPAIAALPVLWFLRRNARTTEWTQPEIRRSMMFLLLGTMLYTAMLTLAAGRWPEAVGILLAIPIARRIARSIALT
ncbi:MAG: UbiA family prenyltransferase [Planctomycetota bacterium]